MRLFNRICGVAYELALLLTLLLAILAPIHALSTRHFTLVEKTDASHAVITGDFTGMQAGTLLKLYRFNPDYKLALGDAHLESVQGSRAVISFDPAQLPYPVSPPDEYAYRTQAASFENRTLSGI